MPSKRSKSSKEPRFASAARFEVDWGGPAGSTGFLKVEFAPFSAGGKGGQLVLTRAFTGAGDLLSWLQAPGKRKPRTLTVHLFDAAGAPLARLGYAGAQPLAHAFSPLDAVAGGLVLESLTVGFTGVSLLA